MPIRSVPSAPPAARLSRRVLLGALALGAAPPVLARPGLLRGLLRDRLGAQGGASRRAEQFDKDAPAVPPGQTIAYGRDPMQTLDFWAPDPAVPVAGAAAAAGGRAPLVVFVHGGAWSKGTKDNGTGRWKIAHWRSAGYAFATIDYRLVPAARVEDQVADVAAALRALRDRADALGVDPARVVLMGHSAGAHLVALVGTDPAYLASAGLSYRDLAGVIAIDGAAYDVPRQIADAGTFMRRAYAEAFGSDAARQQALSPTLQAAAANVAHMLLLHVQRPDGVAQAQGLASALRAGGTAVEVAAFAGTGLQGHVEINRRLGDPSYPATATVDRWLAARFAR